MGLLESQLADRLWARVRDGYAVTRKPPGLTADAQVQVPFAPMDAIPEGGEYRSRYANKVRGAITSGTYFERGDLLVAKITPSFENGKQALTSDLPAPFGYATTEVIPLRPVNDQHDQRFLFFYLLHPDIRHFVAERMEGSTGRQRVPSTVLLDLPIPDFSLPEQRAIADVLEIVQKARSVAALGEANASALKRATMHELFTHGLRGEPQKETEIGPVPESWKVEQIGTLFAIMQGVSLKGNLSESFAGVPFLRTSNVYWGRINLRHLSRMHASAELIGERTLCNGDLLVCEGGEIGRAAVWRGEVDGCTYQNHIHRLRPRSEIHPAYVAAWLEEGFVNRQAYEGAGNKTTIPNLSRSRLSELWVPVASPAEQDQIAAILGAIDATLDIHRRKRVILSELLNVLLHHFMTGVIRIGDLSA